MSDQNDDKPKGPWYAKRPNDEELKKILDDHAAWVEADTKGDPPHDLTGIDLRDRNLRGADLRKANLSGAALQRANLSHAKLEEAQLNDACLQRAELNSANLEKAQLFGANLQKAKLIGIGRERYMMNMKGAKLCGADLRGAALGDANLQGAEMRRADLRGATLVMVNLFGVDVSGVRYNRKTKCRSVRVDDCFGSPRFKRFVLDQDYLAEFKEDHPVWYRLWWLFADCGRSLWPWAAWSVVMALGFALVYYFGFDAGDFKCPKKLGWSLWTTIYYSVVTFTTLGFGDITPQDDKAAMWVMAEVVVGYIMLGGLISILANKLARRS